MEIKTKRLILRELKSSDAKSLQENLNNLNVSKWLEAISYPYSLKDAKSFISMCKKEARKKPRVKYEFAVVLKEGKINIGSMGLYLKTKHRKASLGYWIGEKYWRKGYGSEALKSIINFAFKKLKLIRLEAEIYPRNPSSGKLLEKHGFVKEGLMRKSSICKADGKIKDSIAYGLVRHY